MIKVEHTKTHKIVLPLNHPGLPNSTRNVSVTDAELVLVGLNTIPKGQLWLEGRNIFEAVEKGFGMARLGDPRKFIEPILISRTEKIEVGDWYLHSNSRHNSLSQGKLFKSDDVFNEGNNPNKILVGEGRVPYNNFKILALPEHFSPQQLQDIVDGKLKGGKCLVECIQEEPIPMTYKGVDSRGDYLYYCPKCGHGGSYMGTGQVHCYKDECRPTTIKLNPPFEKACAKIKKYQTDKWEFNTPKDFINETVYDKYDLV